MVRLLSMDLDDTLLRADKTISPYTLATLERCRAAGVLTAFNTARGESRCLSYIDRVRPDFVISNGGALITQNGQPLFSLAFTPEETRRLIALGRESSREIAVDTQTRYYTNSKSSAAQLPLDWGEAIYTDYADFDEPALKLSMRLPDPAAAERIAAAADCDWLGFAGSQWYKFTRRGATKEDALARLCARLDIPLSDVAAFGDDYSDIGSLRRCGHGVAMANAAPEVRRAANDSTSSNDEDGVARWIVQNVLGA